jgi:hypothetical protein
VADNSQHSAARNDLLWFRFSGLRQPIGRPSPKIIENTPFFVVQKSAVVKNMSWFSKREAVAEAEPAPIDREAELLGRLHEIDAELAVLNHWMRDFRSEHGIIVNRFNQIVSARGDSLGGLASTQREWRLLLHEADRLLGLRNPILKALAAIRVPGFGG